MSLPSGRDELIRYLKENYATEEREGVLYVYPEVTYFSPEVVEYKVADTTPIVRRIRQDVVRNYVYRNVKSVSLYGAMGLFRKVCVMYKDPNIVFDLIPVKTKNVVFHMLSFKITGDIVNSFTNKSTEGEEGTYVTRRWKACPTDPSVYTWKPVPGSADLTPNWAHSFTEDQTSTYLSKVSQSTGKVQAGAKSPDVSASWSTGGIGDVILTLLNIFLKGRVTLRNGYDVTVKYTWKGQTQTVNRHVDAKVIVPVEGSVGVSWD
jgi:hypothetical protein